MTAEDGTAIGSGQLYIYSPWNATAYAGTVDSIKVSVGDELSAGKTIMVLSDVGYSAAYRQLISQRQEYENLMKELFQMYRTETITAPCDGVVSGVDKDSAYLLSDSSDSKAVELLASSGIRQDNGYVVNTVQAIKKPEKGSVILTLSAGSASEPNPAPEPEPTDPQPIDPTPTEPTPSEPTPTEPTPSEPTPTEPPVETVVYYGYVAQVMELADGKLKVKQTPYSYTITDLNQLPFVTVDVNAMTQEAIYDISRITLPVPAVNDYLLLIVAADGTLTHFVQQQPPTSGGQPGVPSGPGVGGGGGFPSGGGYPSGGMSGGYPSGSMTEQESAYELYGLDMVQIAAVTPQDTMTLDITIDELDIKALQVGMTAQVKINALGGEKYTAAITEIGNTGVSDGGNSKYTVELTMDRAEKMLSGMNATATIVLSTAMDVLTIPADALVEQGNQTVIYTGYDEENEVLLNPVTVKVGCSDGETVEILEGLVNGQTYYYAYYDTLEISFTPDFGAGGFMFG